MRLDDQHGSHQLDQGIVLRHVRANHDRHLVGARQQRDIAQAVWEAILEGIDHADRVELAYPTVRTYFRGPVTVTGDGDGTD